MRRTIVKSKRPGGGGGLEEYEAEAEAGADGAVAVEDAWYLVFCCNSAKSCGANVRASIQVLSSFNSFILCVSKGTGR